MTSRKMVFLALTLLLVTTAGSSFNRSFLSASLRSEGLRANAATIQRPADGALLGESAYVYPSLDSLRPRQQENLSTYYTPAEYETAMREVRNAPFQLRDLWYASDGLRIRAYLYRPASTEGRRLPVIIYNRGSLQMGDQGFIFAPFFHRLAKQGFVIIAPQYRGSAGGEGKDEAGGADVHDVLNAIVLARHLDYVDPANVFMYGESRGGMMALQAIREGAPINAAATFGAFTDLERMLASMAGQDPRTFFPDWDAHKNEILERRSALRWADKLTIPLLLMHGGADPQVSPSQTLDLAQRLQELKRTYELIVYAGDGHILKNNQEDRDRRAIAWFQRHMKRAVGK